MKRPAIWITAALTFLGGIGFLIAQSPISVPEAVQDAFTARYPAATSVDWEMEGEGEYEAEFRLNNQRMSAVFATDGTWLETETAIRKGNLPAAVKSAIRTSYAGFDVEEAEQVERPDQPMVYELELENEENGQEMEVMISAAGDILKSVAEEDGGEEDED